MFMAGVAGISFAAIMSLVETGDLGGFAMSLCQTLRALVSLIPMQR